MSSIATEAAVRDANIIIEQQLSERAAAVETAANADLFAYLGPISEGTDDLIKDAVEGMAVDRRRSLVVLLETYGGYITVAERIALILRYHYRRVSFLVPSFAMSAGTVLVMSGDAILMDYASVLGPIDPQVERRDSLVPALGYLEWYERLVAKSARGELTTAELMYLVQNFDAAELYRFEQERDLSIALLEEWLVKYKFKNWKETGDGPAKTKVTPQIRRERAREIAMKLNDTKRWHSHGRGIPMEVLRRDVKLQIDDFGSDQKLRQPIHDYYRLLKDYMMRLGNYGFVLHRKGSYVGY